MQALFHLKGAPEARLEKRGLARDGGPCNIAVVGSESCSIEPTSVWLGERLWLSFEFFVFGRPLVRGVCWSSFVVAVIRLPSVGVERR